VAPVGHGARDDVDVAVIFPATATIAAWPPRSQKKSDDTGFLLDIHVNRSKCELKTYAHVPKANRR